MTQKLKLALGAMGFAALIGIALFAYNKLGARADAVIPAAEQGEKYPAPDFSMLDHDGSNVTLSAMIGLNDKPIVLNFWASWCPPCKSEMPEFDKVYGETGDAVRFMMVDLTDGRRETVEKGARYVQEQGFSFPVYFDVKGEGAYAYGIRSIPTTLFIDRDGFIVTGVQGAINEQTLRKGIALIR